MPTDFPVALSSNTVGALALALPFIAVFLVGIIKGAFYHFARKRWQIALPDKLVWPAVAGIICIITSLILKIDVGGRIMGGDWPTAIPWWLNAIASGIILTALSTKVIYPLMVEPAEKAKAKIDSQAAIAKASTIETKVVPASPWSSPPTIADVTTPTGTTTQITTYNDTTGEYNPIIVKPIEKLPLPRDVNISEPVLLPKGIGISSVVEPLTEKIREPEKTEVLLYKTLLLTRWKPGLYPTHVLIERSNKTQKVIELSKYKEVSDSH